MTQALAEIEGMERGPAGNTSLAAAFSIAQEMDREQILVIQETEYTGAGKHPLAQLNLAKQMGVQVLRGNPRDNEPGKRIVIPERLDQFSVVDVDLQRLQKSYLQNIQKALPKGTRLSDLHGIDVDYLCAEVRTQPEALEKLIRALEQE